MSLRQLPLDLPPVTAMGRADFFEAPCNAQGLAAMANPTSWPVPRMILAGPKGSGRTHLAHVFLEATGGVLFHGRSLHGTHALTEAPAVALDDASVLAGDPVGEEALFHLYNATAARGAPLLLIGPDLPGTWGIELPDLASRLAACAVTQLAPPDDMLLTMVLAKLFDDRQLSPDPELLDYLLRRMERSLDAARDLVAAIDRAALASRRKPSRALAAEVLAEFGKTRA
ncbi:MAG: chromosomal replication initiator DnaA [Mangrovicoccus sp.]|nr:chromosomal replication initiator DnaA [Mangrovicoccus sp.]